MYMYKPTQYPLSQIPHRVTGVSLPATLRKGCDSWLSFPLLKI